MWKRVAVFALMTGGMFVLANLAAERMRESYSFLGVQELDGQKVGVLRPMRPISLAVVQESGDPLPRGEILTNCEAHSRVTKIGEAEVREMTLTCGNRLLVVKGVLYDAAKK